MEKNPILFRKLGVLVVKKGSLIFLKISSYEVQMILNYLNLEHSGFRFFQLEKNPIYFQTLKFCLKFLMGSSAFFSVCTKVTEIPPQLVLHVLC